MFDNLKKNLGIYSPTEKALISMLKDIEIFKDFNEKQLYELSQKFKLEKYVKDSKVVIEWEKYGKIGLLESGNIKVFKNITGNNIQLWEVVKWEIFGEMAFFTNNLPMATLITYENCIVWEIDYDEFKKVLEKYPEIYQKIITTIKKRHTQNVDKLEEIQKNPELFNKNYKKGSEEEEQEIQTIKINIKIS